MVPHAPLVISTSLKERVLARLCQLDEALAIFVRASPEQFGKGIRSARGLLRDKVDVGQIKAGTLPGRIWILLVPAQE